MADTLGSLCDKLTIIKLKQWHSSDTERLASLQAHGEQIQAEINEYIGAALGGLIPLERLVFPANKVYKQNSIILDEIVGNMGELFAQLAHINCALWHEQEKVYDFENIPLAEKDVVVKKLAVLNLQRNQCIDGIDIKFCNGLNIKVGNKT